MKRIIFLCFFALFAGVCVMAEQTAYEKKVEEICIKYYCYGKYGYNGGLDMEDIFAMGMYGAEPAARLALLNYTLEYDARQGKEWTNNMERELESAKSLMTDVDFHKIFLKTTCGQAMMVVKEQLDAKFIKDEFETQAQFVARAKKEAAKEFDRLCTKLVLNMNSTLKLKISPIQYDAERGAYQISVEESANFSKGKGIENSYKTWLPMKAELARRFEGYDLSQEQILSVTWMTIDNEITVGEVSFMDNQGKVKKFTHGREGAIPLIFAYDNYRETNPLLPGYIWAASNIKSYYEQYSKKLANIVEEYNKKIIENKYYDILSTVNYKFKQKDYSLGNVDKYDEVLLQKALVKKEQEIKKSYNIRVTNMKEDCRNNDPNKFISIYASEHPDFVDKVAALEADYKCYHYEFNKLAFYVIDSIKPSVSKCFDRYITLFNNSDEFYSLYDDDDRFDEEVAIREGIYKKYQSVIRRLSNGETLSFKAAKEKGEPDVVAYINALDEFKIVNKWYESALEAYFNADSKMMKEYGKVANLFTNKESFFNSYISSSYKNDLKNAKKSK